jgi:catechol 2,3-dioxygenase-like lactoylglutathione lyase family enzyme
MPISHLEHLLLQVADIDATCDWYEEVVGLRRGPTPDFKFPVQWLYAGDKDVLHVTVGGKDASENRKRYVGQQSEALSGTGVIDHVAFRATGLKDTLARLRALGVPFKERMVSDQGLYQVFMFDPNQVKVELNFSNEEAQRDGIVPDLLASNLPG